MELNLHDITQWVALAVMIMTFRFRMRQRDQAREDITKWRTNIDRDVLEINKHLDRHEEHGRIYDRLDAIVIELNGVSERLVKIESLINGKRGN